MASVSENKIRAMEEEMNRFEKEISQVSVPTVHNPKGAQNSNHQSNSRFHQPHNYGNLGIKSQPRIQFVPHQLNNSGMQGSQIFNINHEKEKMGSVGDSNSALISMPVVISAKPTVYVPKQMKKVEKSPIREVIIPEKSMASSSSALYNTSTTSFSKVGPAAYPQNPLYEEKKKERKLKKIVRVAGGQVWDDNTLLEWDQDDFRVFCGDLGNDVTDEVLSRTFSRYPSFMKAKVVRDKRTNKTRGYGFVSFRDPQDFIRAMKDVNGKYVGSRPIKLRKSTWKDRNIDVAKKKTKEKQRLGLR